MKLLNHTLLYLSVSLLGVLGLWAVVFYFFMLQEVKETVDDGLTNYKMFIVHRAQGDTSMLSSNLFGDKNYRINEISAEQAIRVLDTYKDTLIYQERLEQHAPVRLLTTAFVANEKYYELKIISAVINKADLIRKLFLALAALYGVMLASILVVNNFVLKKIWKPFHYLLTQLRNFKLGNTPLFKPAHTSVKEFRELNDSLQSLLQRNSDTYLSQKQFNENASHELQTPLAISINKLELLAERGALTDEDAATVGEVIQALESLKRLNKALLLLSKIENQQFAEEQIVRFNDIFQRLVRDFADLLRFRKVQIQLLEDGSFEKQMNYALAEILVINLLKNAIVHNIPGGAIVITVSDSGFGIENTGDSSEPLDEEKMFNRFYKRSAESGSTGLGLAIVKAIAGLYHLSAYYTFSAGKHMFSIQAGDNGIGQERGHS
ncbi:MAG TPA: HAMP domain-containing sensor histidine kinase [Niabella sp.]|nr:HAMP domain-containing sensor histidine kinase [Niabella sp.]